MRAQGAELNKPVDKPSLLRGPAPTRVKIDGDWRDAVKKALAKKKPAEGWPKPEPVPQRARKGKK